jgi:cytochrome c556
MNAKLAYALGAVAFAGACGQQVASNQANAVTTSAETRNAAAAAPLSHDKALAVMKQRHDAMESRGDATKAVHNALQAAKPDLGAIRAAGAKVDALAPKLLSLFPAGTGPDVGKTRAKPEIWQKPEDFANKAHDFGVAANQFDVAAKSGDLAQINATFGALGKACKACHDLYRAPEKH